MRKKWWIVPLAIIGIPLFIFVGGEVVMHLWNWLLPPLFGLKTLGFWQALGLLLLCRILFGGLGSWRAGTAWWTRVPRTVPAHEPGGAGEVSEGDGGGV